MIIGKIMHCIIIVFLGLNNSETIGPSTYSPDENRLHQWLQDMLSSAADVSKYTLQYNMNTLDGKYLCIDIIFISEDS